MPRSTKYKTYIGKQSTSTWSSCLFGAGLRPDPPSMNLRLRGRLRAGEEIEIAALVGLADVLREHRAVAARVAGRRRLPGGAAAAKLVVADMQVDAAPSDVDLD